MFGPYTPITVTPRDAAAYPSVCSIPRDCVPKWDFLCHIQTTFAKNLGFCRLFFGAPKIKSSTKHGLAVQAHAHDLCDILLISHS